MVTAVFGLFGWVPYEKGSISIGPGMIDAYNFNNHVLVFIQVG